MSALAYDFDRHGHLVPPAPRVPQTPSASIMERRSPRPADVRRDRTRDARPTPFGKATLTDRYLMPGESFQDVFARVSCAYADDVAHAQRFWATFDARERNAVHAA